MSALQEAKNFRIFITNPAPAAERIDFSFITPRALPVLAAATPKRDYIKGIRLIDQSVEAFPWDEVEEGDLVGISMHTFNAIHGYALAEEAKKRGATVVFGGPHPSIFPEETLLHGDAAVTGDAEDIWADVLDDYAHGNLKELYRGGQVDPESFTPARWDLMNTDRYLTGSVQTVRGCPKQCSFCSVWVQDGQVPRVRANDAIILELQELYRAGFRLVMFSDDNFYPYSLADIAKAPNPEQAKAMEAGRANRLELLARLEKELPNDLHFCTQITMEVADDPEYMAAMRRAGVLGALIGIESVTEEGLKATNKTFNSAGKELARKLETIRTQGFPYILGAFIFGIETDTEDSLDYTIQFARDSGIAMAQFVPMTPLPGTVDFHMMRRGRMALKLTRDDYDYWLDLNHPRILYEHPNLSEKALLSKLEDAWGDFYSLASVLARCRRFGMFKDWRKAMTYIVVSRGLLSRYKRYGLSADSAVRGTKKKLATLLGRTALSLMRKPPMTGPVEQKSTAAAA
jgi:radical SAM superfamily enzyme YgiQ (UPF0313 family)